jgi:hypothetical protein
MKTMVIQNRKAAVANFEAIDPKVASQIKQIYEHPDYVEAQVKLAGLKTESAGIEKKISLFYSGPCAGSGSIPSPEKDGAAILAGTPVTELAGQSKDTELKNLHRQRDALLKAIEMQNSEIQQLTSRLIREGCELLEPFARKYIEATVAAFEAVKKALENQEKFFTFINQRGYATNLRPGHWQTWPFELAVLYGGVCSLDFYLEQRRKVWGLDEKK